MELSRIERKVLLRATRERVWNVLTTAEHLSQWFEVEITGTVAPGARVRMKSTNAAAKGVEFDVTIDRMEAPRLFSWRWHPGMPIAGLDYEKEPTTLVEFELLEVEGGTEVTVRETGFDGISLTRRASVFADNEKGWEYMAGSLERYTDASAER